MSEANRALLVERLLRGDPWEAHRLFFSARWRDPPAGFHPELARDFWRPPRRKQTLGFRGCGKSTIAEESITLAAASRTFNNIVIIGASEARAAERLAVVAFQLTMNDALLAAFGEQKGPVWTQTKLVLSRGNCVQAMGRDQDIRGLKHMDWRPDCVVVDDFEDKESVQTPAAREKTLSWFMGELLLACDPDAWVLILGTPLDEESVPMRLRAAGWPTRIIPVESPEGGPAWPERFSAEWVAQERRVYARAGRAQLWSAEMMMQPRAAGSQTFTREMIRVEPREHTWQAVYAMIDPARTKGAQSATTGWAVWSWIGNRLIVWAAGAEYLLPDEIVELAFRIDEQWRPVWLGVEQDGLHAFLTQPLRREMARRGVVLPLRAMLAREATAGLGKIAFIRGLQPFFAAGEVSFAGALPELEEQLLGFPTGKIDAPNALAYALKMRAEPVYEDFGLEQIDPAPTIVLGQPLYLAGNADGVSVVAALCQFAQGQLRVFRDWVVEGEPGVVVPDIHAEAALWGNSARMRSVFPRPGFSDKIAMPVPRMELHRTPIVWRTPPRHADRWNNIGLLQAIGHIPADAAAGGDPARGRNVLSGMLKQRAHGRPAVVVGEEARWTLRAFTGGYGRLTDRKGQLKAEPEEGPYKLLMEGLESFVGMTAQADVDTDMAGGNYVTDRFGRRYLSAMPVR